ncbi:MAG: 16S rRNA (cytidine(1402)-2'-O)-methyltransferase [Pseudomonadota bacterium]
MASPGKTAETNRPGLAPGLYFVATPIGNARDITLRALDILAEADVLVAEDTRSLRRLMEIHGVALGGRRVLAHHDHNEVGSLPGILAALGDGKSVAYASEAGTPLVSDPGYPLGRAAAKAGHPVIAAPGASAALAALTVSGLASDCFVFAGFPPTKSGARKQFLKKLADVPGTLILFESPKRLSGLLTEAADVLGGAREAAVCRELTKKFEEVTRGPLDALADAVAERKVKGEIVVCIARGERRVTDDEVEEALRDALQTQRIKDAAATVSEALGLSKRDVYQRALRMKDGD